MPTLYGIHYSPWTERARWALDHHGIAYRYREHVPMLEEPLLRWRAKAPAGTKASVPLFVDGAVIHRDSLDIVLHADRVGRGTKLVHDEASFRALGAVIERGMRAARARYTSALLADPEALNESARSTVPAFMAPLVIPIVKRAARFIESKYDAKLGAQDADTAILRDVIDEVRRRVDTSSVPTPKTLTGEQLIFAALLNAVRQPEVAHSPLLPAQRRAWTCAPLASEIEPLLRWRDATYAGAR